MSQPVSLWARRRAIRAPLVMVAEDSESDLLMMRIALNECDPKPEVQFVRDGDDLLQQLVRRKEMSGVLPDLIVLDLNLPGSPGLEVLQKIKRDRALAQIPLVVLSASSSERDISRATALHANSYVVKPTAYPELTAAVKMICHYWLSTNAPQVDAKALATA